MSNMILEVVIPILTIVASVIGLLYLFFFSYTVYRRLSRPEDKYEWIVKSNFYVGIGLFLISNMALAYTRLHPSTVITDVAIALNFIALLVFVYAIHARMKTEAQREAFAKTGQTSGKKKR